MECSRSCKIGTAGIICGVLGIALFSAGVVLFALPPPVETVRCEGFIYPITCDVCERSDLVLVCPVVSTWTRNNATVCSDPRTCIISGVSLDDFGVYLCGGNVYSVHVLIRGGSSGNCSPPSWRIGIGALFILFAVALFVGCVTSLMLAETIRKLCCGMFD